MSVEQAVRAGAPVAAVRRARRGRVRPGVLAAAVLLGLILLAALAPSLLAHGSPTDTDPVHALQAPGGAHWFGTDQLGRDVFARVVHGTRYSLAIGAAATGAGVGLAVVWGLAAALSGRFGDAVLMRAADALLALPGLLLALMVVLIAGKGCWAPRSPSRWGRRPGSPGWCGRRHWWCGGPGTSSRRWRWGCRAR